MPQLVIADFLPQIFWLFIIFALFYLLMSRLTLPKVSATLDKRQKLIQDQLDAAQSMRTDAEKMQKHYQQLIAQARQKAHEQLQQTALSLKKELGEREQVMNRQLSKTIQDAEARIANLRARLHRDLAVLVPEAVKEILQRLADLPVSDQEIAAHYKRVKG